MDFESMTPLECMEIPGIFISPDEESEINRLAEIDSEKAVDLLLSILIREFCQIKLDWDKNHESSIITPPSNS